MYKNMNAPSLCTDRRGAIAVEFVFIMLFLIVFLVFFADLMVRQAMTGKLDRTSYSVAGVLRERIQLFAGREELQQNDVIKIKALARRMLLDMQTSADLSRLSLYVEEVHFVDPTGQNDNRKTVRLYRKWPAGEACMPKVPLDKLIDLSPRGSYGRWVPLYQVTVCLPTQSMYTRLTSEEEHPVLSSFAIVMAR